MKIIKLWLLLMISTTALAATDDTKDVWQETLSAPKLLESKAALNPTKWVISPYGIERRFESATNPVMVAREPLSIALGFRKIRDLVSIEYSRFSEYSGNDTYHVSREFQDLLGWYRYSYYKNNNFRATVGGGLGFYQEQISTSFYGIKQELNSGNKWTAATGLGLEYEPIQSVVFFIEARLITGQNLDPNPSPDALARVSVQF